MKIENVVECMSKSYLHRILDSYTKDIVKPDDEGSRKKILSDKELLSKPENIERRLQFSGISFDSKILSKFLIESLLDAEDYSLDETHLINAVVKTEEDIINEAKNPEVFKFKPVEIIKTYQTVLEVALEDDTISEDEKRLLTRLRTHLGLNLRDHYLIQAKLGKFPKSTNELHSVKEIKSELIELQKRGIVFFCNLCKEGAKYLIPEDIVTGVKKVLGIELGDRAYQLLLEKLNQTSLKVILEGNGLPVSGVKEEQVQRVLKADITPSAALGELSVDDLHTLCKSLPGVNVSGSKATRIQNVIEHFDKLRTSRVNESADPREKYYEYFVELARRDRQNLLSNKIIQKDINMDKSFEEGARYLFEEMLGLTPEKMEGVENPDGLFSFGKAKESFMWDTKSKESTYQFPNDHLNQFKKYIHNSIQRVSCFLVIAPDLSEKCLENAFRLKSESHSDTDVALISAEDLKWVAENWKSMAPSLKRFDLDVFNFTGVLDRATLKQRMKIFLK